MSTLLGAAGIRPLEGFDPAHLEPPPDLVVIGNAVPRNNPEAVQAETLGVPVLSMPQALARFFLEDRRPLVVAGTHGKTTTTSLAAWTWVAAGRDPGYLIGGLPKNLPASFAVGSGDRFVIEGDEYNAAYFDRGPKFLHYRPQTLILTSVEYDHADLYPSVEALREAYRQLVRLLPADGLLVAWGDDPAVRAVAREARCPVCLYGLGPGNDLAPVRAPELGAAGSRFVVADDQAGEVALALPAAGRHNVANALAVWAAARADGLPPEQVATAFAGFEGVARRLEELGSAGGVTVVDDFAHHPTAVGESLRGLAQRYPGRRRIVLFEPRSLTAGRAFFFEAYLEAFAGADRVLFAPAFHAGRLAPEERLEFPRLAAALGRAGVAAEALGSTAEVLARAVDLAEPGDVLVTMSSGSFEGLPRRLLAALGERSVAS
jgi:UDP-N-acetylmuramate: L-alanyl-gamma-D-glutamyl-meso-diaminopimelate ligase